MHERSYPPEEHNQRIYFADFVTFILNVLRTITSDLIFIRKVRLGVHSSRGVGTSYVATYPAICNPILPKEEQMHGHDGTAGGHIWAKAFSYPIQLPQEAVETGSALESALVRLRRIQAVSEVVSGAKCCFVVSAPTRRDIRTNE